VDPELRELLNLLPTRTVPGPAGAPDVGVTIYTPRNRSGRLPCIFRMHGGGYVTGSALQRVLHPLAGAVHTIGART